MSALFTAVVSVTPTKRRRWLWAAWWTAPPQRDPFRPPDAAEGGAGSHAEALQAAAAAAGRPLLEIEGRWARAFARTLSGLPPWSSTARDDAPPAPARRPSGPPQGSIWELLGVSPRAEIDEIRKAFQRRALELHPDHGGDEAAFRALRGAYEEALRRRSRDGRRPRARRPAAT